MNASITPILSTLPPATPTPAMSHPSTSTPITNLTATSSNTFMTSPPQGHAGLTSQTTLLHSTFKPTTLANSTPLPTVLALLALTSLSKMNASQTALFSVDSKLVDKSRQSSTLTTLPIVPTTTKRTNRAVLPSNSAYLQSLVEKSLARRRGLGASGSRLQLAGDGENPPMLAYADTIIKIVLVLCAVVVVVIPLLAWARRRRKRYLRPAPRLSTTAWARHKVRRFFLSPVQTTRLLFQRLDAEQHWYQSIPGASAATEDDALLCDEEEVGDEATFVGVSQPLLSDVSNV